MLSRFLQALCPWLVRIGVALLALSGAALVSVAFGLVPSSTFAIGQQSGLRTLAEVAVVGCLAAAMGYWND